MFIYEAIMVIRNFISLIGVVIICVSAVYCVVTLLHKIYFRKPINTDVIRLQFGRAVTLGLEFMVGADIVATIIKPDYYDLGILVILVFIRTILSYFLNKELENLKV